MRHYGIVGTSELYAVAAGLEYALPAGAVAVDAERPAPGAVLQPDGTWRVMAVPEEVEPEPLDLNGITYAQADAIMRADSVEDLRLAVLDVLGL
ncbi:hypothetical protein [Nitratidesulfovibrio sp. 1201_IL3209]|uniref:hypothetical protein n=1 Tax=Nitratidesulfovibrio sp. 1201_IL3209 TaxID=3084053 RepID=UPI002FD98476